jgi:hypothetical protein
MNQERIMWVVAVLLVGAAAFFGGRQLGVVAGQESRSAAAAGFFAQRGGQGGQGGQGFGGGRGQGVSGMVASVDGTTVSLTLNDGSTVKVSLAADGVVRHQVEGTIADVKVGERVVAIGTQSGDTFAATALQVGGGPGGPGGPGAAPRTPTP